mgnify:CR=1 FL=1
MSVRFANGVNSIEVQTYNKVVEYGSVEVWQCNHKDTIFGKEG